MRVTVPRLATVQWSQLLTLAASKLAGSRRAGSGLTGSSQYEPHTLPPLERERSAPTRISPKRSAGKQCSAPHADLLRERIDPHEHVRAAVQRPGSGSNTKIKLCHKY
jgi:hypothetical protein